VILTEIWTVWLKNGDTDTGQVAPPDIPLYFLDYDILLGLTFNHFIDTHFIHTLPDCDYWLILSGQGEDIYLTTIPHQT